MKLRYVGNKRGYSFKRGAIYDINIMTQNDMIFLLYRHDPKEASCYMIYDTFKELFKDWKEMSDD